jgi:hypothetical protein
MLVLVSTLSILIESKPQLVCSLPFIGHFLTVGAFQRIDIEIVDSSPRRNVYLSKRGVTGETRLAVTSHADGDVGVCFKNHLDLGALTH